MSTDKIELMGELWTADDLNDVRRVATAMQERVDVDLPYGRMCELAARDLVYDLTAPSGVGENARRYGFKAHAKLEYLWIAAMADGFYKGEQT